MIYVWDDVLGLKTFKYIKYAYQPAINGEYRSIYGDKLTKTYQYNHDDAGLFESDVPETTRTLIDMYSESDDVSNGHTILTYDIECEMISGLPDPLEATNELTSIALHSSYNDQYWVLVMDKDGSMVERKTDKAIVIPFQREEDMLLKYLELYEQIAPTIVTGWNCIPTNSNIWKKHEIVKLNTILKNDVLYDSKCTELYPVSEKIINTISLKNGECLDASSEHKFLVRYKHKSKYTNLQSSSNTYTESYLSTSDIREKSDMYDIFFQVNVNDNTNNDIEISDDCLYAMGLIYTDGSISKTDKCVSIYNNDYNLICEVKKYLDTQKRVFRTSNFRELPPKTTYRLRTWMTEYNELTKYINFIWNPDIKCKQLNVNLLSKLSKRQFWIFMSGCIDGDGHVFKDGSRGVNLCNYNGDIHNFVELIRWNGAFSYSNDNQLTIPMNSNNLWLKKYLILKIKYKKDGLQSHNTYDIKYSRSKTIKWRYDSISKSYFVALKSIEVSDKSSEMMDISCTGGQFKYRGISTHNCDNFDTPMLYNRIKRLLGETTANRLSPIGECYYSPNRKRFSIAGVSYLDYITLYKNYNFGELPNYRLDTVAKIELGRGKIEYDGNLDELFKDDIEKFIEYNLVDVELVVDFEKKLQFIELCRGICHAGHVPYEDFPWSSKYLEGALLTYLRRGNLVAPNKPNRVTLRIKSGSKGDKNIYMDKLPQNTPTSGNIKISKSPSSHFQLEFSDVDFKTNSFILKEPLPTTLLSEWKLKIDFAGAYVKPPIVGKYDWIFDLDLTSLYPSIIMSLNISPETKIAKIKDWDANKFLNGDVDEYSIDGNIITKENLRKYLDESKYTVASNGMLYQTDIVGCIPGILDLWFNKRVEYNTEKKKWGKLGDKDKYDFYDKRQLVQKILLNSLYGCLGLEIFRFFDIQNAEAVTTTGIFVIKSTADMTNIKYNRELGGQPYIFKLENGETIQRWPNSDVSVNREGIIQIIKAKDLVELDDIII